MNSEGFRPRRAEGGISREIASLVGTSVPSLFVLPLPLGLSLVVAIIVVAPTIASVILVPIALPSLTLAFGTLGLAFSHRVPLVPTVLAFSLPLGLLPFSFPLHGLV